MKKTILEELLTINNFSSMDNLTIGTLVDHSRYGEGVIGKINVTNYEIYFAHGGKVSISKTSDELSVLTHADDTEIQPNIDLGQLREIFNFVLDDKGLLLEPVAMAEKWEGGTINFIPGKEGVQGKEIPIDTFFHKIVMVRDRLRVLEQNINSQNKLSDEEKVSLQQYITRAYGSLTTFNILFDNKEQYFKGSSLK